MGKATIRRLLSTIPVIFGMTIIMFTLARVIPADPARVIAGERARGEVLDKIREQYGLDKPLWQQYVIYISGLAQFDFGESFSTRRSVAEDLAAYFPATIELAVSALAIAFAGGITIGVISAVSKGSIWDQTGRLFAILGLSVPSFWLALQSQIILYQKVDWFPFGGRISDEIILPATRTGILTIDSLIAGNWVALIDAAHHLILPAVILAIGPLATIARVMRTSMVEVMNEDYVNVARAKGLADWLVILRHALRNALLPVVTVAGLIMGYMLGGAVLIETIFVWPGVGRYAARAILSADYNAIMGATILMSVNFIVINILVDISYLYLDPRIRLD